MATPSSHPFIDCFSMKKKHPAIGAPPFMETSIFPPENRHEMYHPSHCRRGYIEETIVWCSSLQPVTADADFTRNGEKMIEKYRKYEISGEKSGIQKSEHPQKHQKLDAELFFDSQLDPHVTLLH